jgi:hypothetical protein
MLLFGPTPTLAHADVAAGSFVFDGSVDAIVHDAIHDQTYVGGTFTQEQVPAGSAGAGTTLGTIGGLARLQADGSLDTSWHPDPELVPGTVGQVRTLALKAGKLYVGGSFTAIGGQVRSNAAAIDTSTGSVTAWNPNPTDEVDGLAAAGSVVFLRGAFSTVAGQARSGLAAVETASGTPTAWNPTLADGAVQTLAAVGPTLYVGGGFTAVDGQSRSGLAAFDIGSGALTTWNPLIAPYAPGSPVYVNALAVSGTSVYVAGNFNYVGGQARQGLAELDASTGAPTTWSTEAVPGTVSAFAVTDSSVYIGGNFLSVGFQARTGLAELSRSTGTATAWNPQLDGYVAALATSAGTLHVGGQFTSAGGQATGPYTQLPITGGEITEPADTTPPTIAVTTPSNGQHVAQGGTVATVFSCNDAESGVTSCTAPATLDTASSGSKTFTVTTADYAGNTTTRSVGYVVDAPAPQPPPVDAVPAVNPPPVNLPNVVVLPGNTTVVQPLPKTQQPKLVVAANIARGQLGHGIGVTLTGVAPKSRYVATLRVAGHVLATIKGSTDATGTAKLKFKLSKSALRQLKGKKTLELRVQAKAADGTAKTMRRAIRVK